MSLPPELLVFGVGVDTSAAEEGLASLGDSAEGVASGLETKLSGASDGLRELGKQSTGASRGLSGLATVVSLVDPRLGGVVRNVSALARGLGVLRLGLGPAALAIGAVTAGLALYQRQQAQANAEAEEAARRADALADALRGTAERAESLQDQIRLLTGEIDSMGLANEQQAEDARAQIETLTAAYKDQIQASEDRMAALNEEIDSGNDVSHQLYLERIALRDLKIERDREIESLEREIEILELMPEYRRLSADAARKEAEAVAEADKRRREAERASERARAEAIREREQLLNDIQRIEIEARQAQETDEERINRIYEERIDLLNRGHEAGIETRLLMRAAAEEEARYLSEIETLREAQSEENKRRITEEASLLAQKAEETSTFIEGKDREAFERRIAMQMEIAAAIASLGDVAALSAQKRADEDNKAAERMLKVSKGIGLAQVAIDTAVGIQKALASFVENPVKSIVAVAGLIAGAVVQTSKIRSQTLHQGGNLSPDEQQVRTVILRDETVTEGGRVLSPEASRRMERGEGGAQTVIIPAFQHFGEFFADVVESGGTPLHDLIYEGRTLGRVGY